MRVATRVFFRSKAAAENRPHAERVEIIRGHHSSDRTLGAIAIAQRCASDFIDDERLEQGRVFFEIEKVGIGKSGETLSASGRAVEREHPVLMRDERIRMDENSFDPTQGRGVRPDTQCQTENSKNGKARTAPKHSEAEAKVLEKGLHFSSSFCPKRFDWVYKCCAARRQETRKQCDRPESDRCSSQKRGIVRRNLVKLRSE